MAHHIKYSGRSSVQAYLKQPRKAEQYQYYQTFLRRAEHGAEQMHSSGVCFFFSLNSVVLSILGWHAISERTDQAQRLMLSYDEGEF